jgi:NitT/TauT family transport system substrate-binding protein
MRGSKRGARRAFVGVCVAFGAMALALPALAMDKITFGTNWKAEGEHGGFYQAVADGTYAKYGLDVTIRQGGPQVNHDQLLAVGRVDFNMGGNLFGPFNFLREHVPIVTVAAIFQKEPQVLLAHPGTGITGLADLKGHRLLIGNDGRNTFYLWLKQVYGLTDEQVRPYTFNPAPFIADKNAVQQGYVTSEPYAIEQQAGFKPEVLMLADSGYDTYSTIIQTRAQMVEKHPDLVQRFVNASIEGWYTYLYGDNTKANALIKKDNPEMTDGQLAFTLAALKQHGIVDSGDALTMGIGAMTKERWNSFFKKTVSWGLYSADLPLDKAFTVDFVDKGVGLDLKRRLLGN